MDPEPEVPTLLYIGRRGRVTERAIGLIYCFIVCYTICETEKIIAIVQIRLPWFALISTLVDAVNPRGPSP